MLKNRLPRRAAPSSNRGGFTLVELLVVIAIIGVLASVTVPAVMGGLARAKQNVGMQNARSIALMMFQFSIDNDGAYPPTATGAGNNANGGSSSTIAFQQLLAGKYATAADIFYLKAPGKTLYKGTNAATEFGATNNAWSVTGEAAQGSQPSGISQTDPDQLPLVYTCGNTIAYTSPGPGAATVDTDGTNPFATQGIPVCYKGNNAKFAVIDQGDNIISKFIPESFLAPTAVTYSQLPP